MVSIRAYALTGIVALAALLTPATAHASNGGSITSPTGGDTVKAGTAVTITGDVANVCDARITVTPPTGGKVTVATAPADPTCQPASLAGTYTPTTPGSYTLTLAAGKGAEIDTVTFTATAPPSPTPSPTSAPVESSAPPTDTPATSTPDPTDTPSSQPSVTTTVRIPIKKTAPKASATPTAKPVKAVPAPTVTVTATAPAPAIVVAPPAQAPVSAAPTIEPDTELSMEPVEPVVAPVASASPTSSAGAPIDPVAMTTVGDVSGMGVAFSAIGNVVLPIAGILALAYAWMARRPAGRHGDKE
ncbi:hypothetical protein GCM10010404_80990 [Nonomuraea africana]|uniref:Carboxypeptidase regulatory-like domain-containing protein n=1 Tax=Nonomuraea africana TaxID=46171 RepID=A0ABR9KWX6_9ACTN|nr:hypothetical protein [Nonomuraea africana]MBE1566523.1 hypothetical protein [Nonomuraea africana]